MYFDARDGRNAVLARGTSPSQPYVFPVLTVLWRTSCIGWIFDAALSVYGANLLGVWSSGVRSVLWIQYLVCVGRQDVYKLDAFGFCGQRQFSGHWPRRMAADEKRT